MKKGVDEREEKERQKWTDKIDPNKKNKNKRAYE